MPQVYVHVLSSLVSKLPPRFTMSGRGLTKPHVLCQYCQGFSNRSRALHTPTDEWTETRDRVPDEEFEHCSNIMELKILSDGSCHLRILLCYSIRPKTQRDIIEFPPALDWAVILKLWDPKRGPKRVGRYRLKLALQFRPVDTFPCSRERVLWICDEADIPLDGTSGFAGAQLRFSTYSRDVLGLAKYWLSQCEKHHVVCGAFTTQPDIMPARLIDFEAKTDSGFCLHIVGRSGK